MPVKETIRLVLDIARYEPNAWALAYWACAAWVSLLTVLTVSDRRTRPGREARRAFAVNMGATVALLLGMGAMCAAADERQARAVFRFCFSAVGFTGPATVHFVSTLVGWRKPLRGVRLALWSIGLGVAILSLATDWVAADVWRSPGGYSGKAAVLTPLALLHVFVCMLVAQALLVAKIRLGRDPIEKRQLKFVLVAYAIGNLAILDVSSLWEVRVLPSLWLWMSASAGILSYAMQRHRLLHAPDLSWRAVSWALASSAVAAIPLGAALLTGGWNGWGRAVPTAAAIFALGLVVRAYLGRVQPRIDRVFWRRRLDLDRELDALSDRLAVLHTADAVGQEIAGVLARTLFVKLVAFAVRDDGGVWRVVHSAWGSVPPPSDDDPALAALRVHGGISRPELVALPDSERAAARAIDRMFARYGAEVLIPITGRADESGAPLMLALAAVGARPDGQPFDAYDIDFLARLRSAIAAPLAAARLYDRRHRFRVELEERVAARSADLARALDGLRSAQAQLVQSEKMATLGVVVAGVATELEASVERVSTLVPELAAHARAYEEAAAAAFAALPEAGEAVAGVHEWARRVRLDFVRRDVGPLVESIAEGARRARGIAADLSRFARDDGSQDEPVDLHRELDGSLNLLRHELKDRIVVERDYAADLPLVECERGPIGQVFLNLLLNAVQAIEGRGRLRVGTRVLPDGHVEVAIRDTGKGIAPEHLGRIFEPFFTTKAFGLKGGTGLGLSISYGIVERHGGRIDVSSTLGEGTEFRITLPVRRTRRPGRRILTS